MKHNLTFMWHLGYFSFKAGNKKYETNAFTNKEGEKKSFIKQLIHWQINKHFQNEAGGMLKKS